MKKLTTFSEANQQTGQGGRNSLSPGVVLGRLWKPCLMVPIVLKRRGGKRGSDATERWCISITWNHVLHRRQSMSNVRKQTLPEKRFDQSREMSYSQPRHGLMILAGSNGMAGRSCCSDHRGPCNASGSRSKCYSRSECTILGSSLTAGGPFSEQWIKSNSS